MYFQILHVSQMVAFGRVVEACCTMQVESVFQGVIYMYFEGHDCDAAITGVAGGIKGVKVQ